LIKRIKTRGGDEYDALSPTRKYHIWGKGQLRRIKRGYNKRLRKALKLKFRGDDDL
jgi:hypothetical protein